MDQRRKMAYRYLLYRATLDIRPLAWRRIGLFNLFDWRWTWMQVRRAGVIADLLHNLAFFSAVEFEHFDEDRFWHDLRHYDERYPDFQLSQYQELFQRELAGEGHLRRN